MAGRMAKPFKRIISADSHVVEPPEIYENALSKRFGDKSPRIINEYAGKKGIFFFSGDQVIKILQIDEKQRGKGVDSKVNYAPEERIAFMDEAGIEAEVIYATLLSTIIHASNLPQNRDMARAAVQLYNDWIAEFCSYSPKRLLGVAAVTTDDPNWAAKEIVRIRGKGLRGIMVNTLPPVDCPPYRSRVYDPIWAAAQDTDTPVTLHIVTGRVRDAIHVHTKEEHADAPATLMDLFAEVKRPLANDFIFGEILDRFPQLKVVCSEFDVNWIPAFMQVVDRVQTQLKSRLELPTLKMKASDYMRTRIWHGIIDDPSASYAIPYVGAGQVCWGSDFPHGRSIGSDAQGFVADLFKEFSRADQEKIVGSNIASVYGVD